MNETSKERKSIKNKIDDQVSDELNLMNCLQKNKQRSWRETKTALETNKMKQTM